MEYWIHENLQVRKEGEGREQLVKPVHVGVLVQGTVQLLLIHLTCARNGARGSVKTSLFNASEAQVQTHRCQPFYARPRASPGLGHRGRAALSSDRPCAQSHRASMDLRYSRSIPAAALLVLSLVGILLLVLPAREVETPPETMVMKKERFSPSLVSVLSVVVVVVMAIWILLLSPNKSQK